RFWGSEAEIGYAWQAGGASWRARLFGDMVRGRLDGGDDLPRVTPLRWGGGLHAHRGPWSASLDVTRVQRQARVASLETRTPGHTLLSANLDWALPAPGGVLLLYLRGRNLLDEKALRHTSLIKEAAPLPGVSVLAGLEWRFD